jgi:DNA-binding MarR family transcriptional regulator
MRSRSTTRSRKSSNGEAASRDVSSATTVELGWLGGTIGYNLRIAQNASFEHFRVLVGESGLRPGRFALLQLIKDNPGISQTVLSRVVGSEKSTLTPPLHDLVRRQLVVRETDPRDQRVQRLTLTKAGERSLASLAKRAALHEKKLNDILGSQRKRQLIDILKFLASALDEAAPTTIDDTED